MKILTTEFKDYCITKFGEDIGDKVYIFYRSLDSKKTSRDIKTSLIERRMKSINFLLENFNEQSILDTIDMFEKKRSSGEFVVNTIAYFNKCVENISKKSVPIQSNPLFIQQKPIEYIKPIKVKLNGFVNEIEALNWIYTCPECSTEFDGFNEICPNCKRIIDWKKGG